MVRSVLGAVVGVVVAFVVVMVWEMATHLISPPPPGLDLRDAAAVRDFMRAMPAWQSAAVVLGYGVAALAGGWIAGLTARRGGWPVWVPAAVLIVATLVNVSQLPHPIWFPAASILIILGGAWLSDRLRRPV